MPDLLLLLLFYFLKITLQYAFPDNNKSEQQSTNEVAIGEQIVTADGVSFVKVCEVGEGAILGLGTLWRDEGSLWQKSGEEGVEGAISPCLVRSNGQQDTSYFTVETFIRLFSSVESVINGERYCCCYFSIDLVPCMFVLFLS